MDHRYWSKKVGKELFLIKSKTKPNPQCSCFLGVYIFVVVFIPVNLIFFIRLHLIVVLFIFKIFITFTYSLKTQTVFWGIWWKVQFLAGDYCLLKATRFNFFTNFFCDLSWYLYVYTITAFFYFRHCLWIFYYARWRYISYIIFVSFYLLNTIVT